MLEVDEVVINMVDYAMVEQVSLASCEYEKGVDEFVKAGFTAVPSVKVKPPRVGESKAVFECKVKQVLPLGDAGGAPNLVICEVVAAHFSEDILDKNGKIDQLKTDRVGPLRRVRRRPHLRDGDRRQRCMARAWRGQPIAASADRAGQARPIADDGRQGAW